MPSLTLSLATLALISNAFHAVKGQSTYPATPLVDKRFSYPTGIPYQVDTEPNLVRGRQTGYNICNSTTEGQESLCQTSFLNSLEDFCLWGPPDPDSTIGATEGEAVAWCSRPGRGTRLIPEGTLKGVQFMRTPDYVQIVGFIDQVKLNIQAGDFGGEMDPHGADLRGNPLGGIFYSNAFSGGGDSFTQVIEWHNFIGSNFFCLKACDPAGPNDNKFCEHIYDRIGCAYNAPNAAVEGQFVSCDGDNQDFPGIYTENGQIRTYTQPPESLGVISTMPYDPKVPASSNCQTFTSSVLFSALNSVSAPGSTPTGTSSAPSGTTPAPTSRSTIGTGSSSAAPSQTSPSSADVLSISGVGLVSVILSALFLS